MKLSVDKVFDDRQERLGVFRPSNLWASVVIHVLLVASLILGPLLAAGEPEPIEFVPIQIVPLQALGVRDPAPASPTPRPEPPAPVVEETEPEKTEPEPEPEAPVLPPPEPAPRKKRTPPPSPTPTAKPSTRPAGGDRGPQRRQGSPLGSSTGSSAFGATVGGFDNPDFVYGYYVDQMLGMISSNWLRPTLSGEIEATVHFRIHRDGHITELRVAQSSGYNSFDLAGLRAVQLAAPFPRLPQSFPHGSLGVNLILR